MTFFINFEHISVSESRVKFRLDREIYLKFIQDFLPHFPEIFVLLFIFFFFRNLRIHLNPLLLEFT